MKTNAKERARSAARVNKHTGKPSYLPHGMVSRLIADVDDAARLLERTEEALKYGGACTCIEADLDEPIPPCPRCELQPLVATFLKEPKR